jgi:hypothetical protein
VPVRRKILHDVRKEGIAMTSPSGPGGAARDGRLPSDRERRAREGQQERVDKAIQAGWEIRWDPDRLEFRASRELLTGRDLDAVLDEIEKTEAQE